MKQVTLFFAAALFVTVTMAADVAPMSGTWQARARGEWLELQLARGRNHNSGHDYRIADFTGLDAAVANNAARSPVSFSLIRQAGTITFSGHFSAGTGSGTFQFTPDPKYLPALQELGIDGVTPEKQFVLTLNQADLADVRELRRRGYSISADRLIEIAIFRITPAWLDELASAGFSHPELKELVTARIGKVTAEGIREYRSLGMSELSLAEAANMGILGATPEYARQLRAAGFEHLTSQELVNFRVGRITAESIAALRAAGYGKLSTQELVNFGIHGVTPEFIREMRAAGFADLSPEQLVNVRIFNVTREFASAIKDAGLNGLSIEQLVQLRIFRVTPEGVRDYRKRHNGSADYDEIIQEQIFDHGRRESRRR